MTRHLRHALVTCAAILLIVVSGVMFAARAAPDATQTASAAAYLATGGTLADLCGDGPGADHDHCPFCRLLADVSPIRPAPRVFRLTADTDLASLADLVLAPLGGTPAIRSRAPPVAV